METLLGLAEGEKIVGWGASVGFRKGSIAPDEHFIDFLYEEQLNQGWAYCCSVASWIIRLIYAST